MNENPEVNPNLIRQTPEVPAQPTANPAMQQAPVQAANQQPMGQGTGEVIQNQIQNEGAARMQNAAFGAQAMVATPAEAVIPVPHTGAPAGQPAAENVTNVKADKKKKTGLIVGIILFVIALGCGIAAVLMLTVFNKKGDNFTSAVTKLLDNGMPANIGINGKVSYTPGDEKALGFSATIDSKSSTTTTTGTMSVSLSGFTNGETLFSADFDGIVTDGSDVFIKINKAAAPATTDDDDMAMSIVSTILTVADQIKGQWIKLPVDSLGSFGVSMPTNVTSSCAVDILNDKTLTKKLSEIYQKNEFLTAEKTERYTAKDSTIYKVTVDKEKFSAFKTAADNEINCSVLPESLELPVFYLGVNGNNDFSKFIFDYDLDDASISVNLDFTYPTSITVTEPSEYTDIEKLSTSFSTVDNGIDSNDDDWDDDD